jgi:hypothetical protein
LKLVRGNGHRRRYGFGSRDADDTFLARWIPNCRRLVHERLTCRRSRVESASGQLCVQLAVAALESILNKFGCPAKDVSGYFCRPLFEIAEQHRQPQLLRQPAELVVEYREHVQVARLVKTNPWFSGYRVGLGHAAECSVSAK